LPHRVVRGMRPLADCGFQRPGGSLLGTDAP
jgi:hypothetical protein